jgi:hypothetical protein
MQFGCSDKVTHKGLYFNTPAFRVAGLMSKSDNFIRFLDYYIFAIVSNNGFAASATFPMFCDDAVSERESTENLNLSLTLVAGSIYISLSFFSNFLS